MVPYPMNIAMGITHAVNNFSCIVNISSLPENMKTRTFRDVDMLCSVTIVKAIAAIIHFQKALLLSLYYHIFLGKSSEVFVCVSCKGCVSGL